MLKPCCFIILLMGFIIGCGHTQSHNVGLISFGDLEGKIIPEDIDGEILEGKDCARIGYRPSCYLSNAVRDALKQRNYDTLIDVEVTNRTGFFVPSNCIQVKGKAINSQLLPTSGVN
ncbi:MAG: hypothetical protein ABIK92_00350 [Pseudomonadota bacterium]